MKLAYFVFALCAPELSTATGFGVGVRLCPSWHSSFHCRCPLLSGAYRWQHPHWAMVAMVMLLLICDSLVVDPNHGVATSDAHQLTLTNRISPFRQGSSQGVGGFNSATLDFPPTYSKNSIEPSSDKSLRRNPTKDIDAQEGALSRAYLPKRERRPQEMTPFYLVQLDQRNRDSLMRRTLMGHPKKLRNGETDRNITIQVRNKISRPKPKPLPFGFRPVLPAVKMDTHPTESTFLVSPNDTDSDFNITSAPFTRDHQMCQKHEKRCKSGQCVLHLLDCPEKTCLVSHPMQCRNKWQCVKESAWCNGYFDCDDKSDELTCDRQRYHSSNTRRTIIVSMLILLVISISLFCCILIHVYRSAHRQRLPPEGAQTSVATAHGHSIIVELLHAFARLHGRNHNRRQNHFPVSVFSFQPRQGFLTRQGLTVQSETLESFISSSEGGAEVVADAGPSSRGTTTRQWVGCESEPPPPYEEVVSLRRFDNETTGGQHPAVTPPPTYESIFTITTLEV